MKKQKLHELIDNASEEETNMFYLEMIDEINHNEWDADFLIEINQRTENYFAGKEQTVSAEKAMEYALNPDKRK